MAAIQKSPTRYGESHVKGLLANCGQARQVLDGKTAFHGRLKNSQHHLLMHASAEQDCERAVDKQDKALINQGFFTIA